MHIAVNGWFWGQMTTGSGQYLHHLVHYLPQVAPGHGFTLLLPAAGVSQAADPLPAGWQVARLSTPVDRFGDNPAKLWFEQVAFPRACQRLGADLAFAPYWGSPWQRPCRVAVTVHDLIPLLLPAYRGGLLQKLYTWLVSQAAHRADLILTDSQASRRDIVERLGVPAEQVHAVLLAADERFHPVTDDAVLQAVHSNYRLPERFILYLGGFDVRKNVPRLVRAYGQFLRAAGSAPETPRLVIAGKLPAADTAFTPDPRRIVAEEGIGDWVHFTGWVEEADKPALYSLASLFVFPSLYEGFGLPVAEAAACGTPVVTSNRSSLPEAAPGAILVNPEDEKELALVLAVVLKSKPEAVSQASRTWLDVIGETCSLLTVGEA